MKQTQKATPPQHTGSKPPPPPPPPPPGVGIPETRGSGTPGKK
jgi:hypothetical protein